MVREVRSDQILTKPEVTTLTNLTTTIHERGFISIRHPKRWGTVQWFDVLDLFGFGKTAILY